MVQRGSIIPSISPQTGIGMPKYSKDHETPLQAKITLLLALCGADPSDIKFFSDGDDLFLEWKLRQIDERSLDYVRTVFYWEDNRIVKFIPMPWEYINNNNVDWTYIIRETEPLLRDPENREMKGGLGAEWLLER